MATGTFTYNALRAKTLKERINCKSFKLDKEMYSRHLFSYGGLYTHKCIITRSELDGFISIAITVFIAFF